MASKGTSEETKESSAETSSRLSKTSTKAASCSDDSSERREASNSTGVVLFRPEARLNPDVLELIFRHLNFKELLAAELVQTHISPKTDFQLKFCRFASSGRRWWTAGGCTSSSPRRSAPGRSTSASPGAPSRNSSEMSEEEGLKRRRTSPDFPPELHF